MISMLSGRPRETISLTFQKGHWNLVSVETRSSTQGQGFATHYPDSASRETQEMMVNLVKAPVLKNTPNETL